MASGLVKSSAIFEVLYEQTRGATEGIRQRLFDRLLPTHGGQLLQCIAAGSQISEIFEQGAKAWDQTRDAANVSQQIISRPRI